MLHHLFKLFWRRKSKHLFLMLELLVSFLLVFWVAAGAVAHYKLAQMPLGFKYENVWSTEILSLSRTGKTDPLLYDKLKRSLSAMPEVAHMSFVQYPPFSRYQWRGNFYTPDSKIKQYVHLMNVDDNAFRLLDIRLLEGRWFSEQDEGAAETPIVLSRYAADSLFPNQSALGKVIADGFDDETNPHWIKVVGIFEDFRYQGELMQPMKFAFQRFSPISSEQGVPVLLLKMQPGTPRSFQAKLNQQINSIRNEFHGSINVLIDMRKTMLQEDLTMPVIEAVAAVFLMVMVAFGLFGVLWQNVNQRIPELGLRRAIGADSGSIYRQIIAEQLLLSGVAIFIGLCFAVQLPITGVLGEDMSWEIFGVASLIAASLILALSLLCAVYPAWRGSRLNPVEALHYE